MRTNHVIIMAAVTTAYDSGPYRDARGTLKRAISRYTFIVNSIHYHGDAIL